MKSHLCIVASMAAQLMQHFITNKHTPMACTGNYGAWYLYAHTVSQSCHSKDHFLHRNYTRDGQVTHATCNHFTC